MTRNPKRHTVASPAFKSPKNRCLGRSSVEIDITCFFNNEEPGEFSASVAEMGENAGRITLDNALEHAADKPLLTTPNQLQALRDDAKGYGVWKEDEIEGWSDEECNALFIQIISGDMREIEGLCMGDDGEIDWEEYERLAERGTIGGRLYQGNDGRIYYYLGS